MRGLITLLITIPMNLQVGLSGLGLSFRVEVLRGSGFRVEGFRFSGLSGLGFIQFL